MRRADIDALLRAALDARVGQGSGRRGRRRDRRAAPRGLSARAGLRQGSGRCRDDERCRAPAAKARRSPSGTPERQVAFRTGISAESRAAALLVAKGFRILARRWKSPVGEIDIVARRRRLLVFVEVKARAQSRRCGLVGHRAPARAHCRGRARPGLRAIRDDRIRDIRFDAMLVAPGSMPRHIPAAFDDVDDSEALQLRRVQLLEETGRPGRECAPRRWPDRRRPLFTALALSRVSAVASPTRTTSLARSRWCARRRSRRCARFPAWRRPAR